MGFSKKPHGAASQGFEEPKNTPKEPSSNPQMTLKRPTFSSQKIENNLKQLKFWDGSERGWARFWYVFGTFSDRIRNIRKLKVPK